MSQYRYSQPSLDSGSIRLLRLMPNEDKTAPIQCQLFTYPLQKLDKGIHLYEALSYVWGGTSKRASIFIDNCDMPITVNLHNALSCLRDRFFERIIWADSVCINQEDEQEKECQIQLMAEIYGQANRVIVYLGEAANDSDQALEDIRLTAENEFTNSSNRERSQEAILKLLERPWFRRMWVLQEVAAARRILIMCGSAQINGYAFCSGFNKLKLSYKTYSDTQSLIRSVTYLIRGAIFRPKYATSPSSEVSLGELIDMYHTREVTIDHDKVYALFGMSSDNPNVAGLSPDYSVPWKTLLQRLIEFILSKGVSIETWDKRKIAVIKSKGCVLGKVSSVEGDSARYDRQHVEINFNNTSRSLKHERDWGTRWTLQASAKPIQQGDLVCLLQGALKPTIIRPYGDHFAIIIIAVTPRQPMRRENEYVERQEPLASTENFLHNFLLVWDLERSPRNLHNRARCESQIEINTLVLEYLETAPNKAVRFCDVALVLGDLEEYEEAGKRFQETTEIFGGAFEIENLYTLACIESFALTCKSGEQWKKAEEFFLQVIRIRNRVQGMDHQDTLSSIANLVSTYIGQQQGDLRAGERDAMTSLTDRIRDNVQITEKDMIQVVSAFDGKIITLLLDLKRDNVPITEEVVKAVVGNWRVGVEEIRLLFDKYSDKVKITEEVVKAVVGNRGTGLKVMRLLLDKRGNEVKITKEVIKAIARNTDLGLAIMKLLFDERVDERSDEVKMIEKVVKAAARNKDLGLAMMRRLLDERDNEVEITEEVVKAAAGNTDLGLSMMRLLLDERGDEVNITEEVVKAAAGNTELGLSMMRLLLDERGDEINITEEVVKAAARNKDFGLSIMKLFLDERGDEVNITEEVVKAAAGNTDLGLSIMRLLLDKRGDEVKITEEVVKAAAGNTDLGLSIMRLLLDKRGDKVKII
ncbi:heterokaryon incompatibility protein-domain-containing protein [Halenospora varia]|nr:heterokaryon incompatibility protein-domain-containing protein [Halenospora varia]